MSREQNSRIAQELLSRIGNEADPDAIAALFGAEARFEIAGDVGALPWLGRRAGRSAVAEFIRDTRKLLDRVRFQVDDILSSEGRAAIVGELTMRVNATGRLIESSFAIILTIANGEIARFQMLEDSFAVSLAARPETSHPLV
jgi:uncharacterized protein